MGRKISGRKIGLSKCLEMTFVAELVIVWLSIVNQKSGDFGFIKTGEVISSSICLRWGIFLPKLFLLKIFTV